MKVFFAFLLLVSSAYANAIHDYAEAPATVAQELKVTTGVSSQSRAQDNHGNYNFAYKEDHAEGGTFRKESGNALGQVIGSYGLRTNDGRVRIVNYVADDAGFRAAIATNEPGTAAQPAAATSISSPGVVHHAPQAAVIAEPVVHAPVADVHHAPQTVIAEPAVHAPVADVHHAPANLHAAAVPINQPLIAEGPGIIQNHAAPIAIANNPIHRPIVEAPSTLIKSYASSIYGPSLLTDNIIFGAPRQEILAPQGPALIDNHADTATYIAPIRSHSPVEYGAPTNLAVNEGYYEPTQYYSNPSGIGYLTGTNVGQFGYQLTYRRKKK